jgi:hypothetical protein
MTDFQHIGSDAKWDGGLDFLYPDPAACPAFEVAYGWPQPEKWNASMGMCLWGYDFHHTAGAYPVMKVEAGDELRYSVTYTALPPDEARKRFEASRLIPALETNGAKFIVFDPSGGPLRTTTAQDPQTTMVWEGGVLDEAAGREGRPSIRIDGPGDAGVGMYQYIFEQNAKRWWVRGWFKTRGVRGRGLELRVKYSYQAQPQDLFYLGGLGDKDWTPFSFITTAPQSRDHTTMAFAADGPGQVWLEGVAFSALKEGEQPEVTSFPVPSGLEPNKDIVIDLAMNEQPGKAVYDESRNGHALLLTQVAWTKKEDGRGFLTFNGTNSTAYIPLKSVLGGQDPPSTDVGESYKSRFPLSRFTYEFWIRPRPPVAHGARMMVLAYARGPWAYIDALPGKEGECQLVWKTGVFKDRGLQSFELKRNIPFDQWSHVAVVHGDGHIGLYVNGQRADEGSYDPQTPGFYFFSYAAKYDIGVAWGGGSWYHGDLGPVRLTAKALTAEEVGERCRNGWPQSAVGRERD